MTPAQEQRLIEVFNNKKVLKAAKKFFDRSFSIMVLEDAGTKKLHIRFVHEDNGQKWMTAADVAALTSVDTRTVRRWCETRAQRQSEHPIPFFRMNASTNSVEPVETPEAGQLPRPSVLLRGFRRNFCLSVRPEADTFPSFQIFAGV